MTLVKVEVNNLEEAEKLAKILEDIDYISNIYIEQINDPEIEKQEHEILKKSVILKKNPAFAKHL
jgi:hypothetical protein